MDSTETSQETPVLTSESSPPSNRMEEPLTQVKYGEDAFCHVVPLSEAAFQVATPTGKALKCRSKYVGIHSKNLLLFEMPDVSPKDVAIFFQRGYVITACVISSIGGGERIYFKSKIEYVVQAGDNSIFLVTLPSATQTAGGLRAEARLQISLDGVLDPNGRKQICKIKDISRQGCLLQIERDICHLKVNDAVEITVFDTDDHSTSSTLTGQVKNKKSSAQYCKLGILFEEESLDSSSALVERLHFCRVTQQFSL
ncbi:PilZ domain-containing protein [Vibrio sonorensis]|uniref:PilZ domain-containing protein n=1 Tax=Vibrio sonorensis TaxID=1004316 RepID=UPI0008DA1DD2|nr:PilZ domain-containing protein [Vibrio sonorensis]